jgi:hypothetical protein
MTGKYPTTINVNFLDAESSILNVDDYLQLLAASTHERMKIQPRESLSCVDPADRKCVDVHQKQRQYTSAQKEAIRHSAPEMTSRRTGA